VRPLNVDSRESGLKEKKRGKKVKMEEVIHDPVEKGRRGMR